MGAASQAAEEVGVEEAMGVEELAAVVPTIVP